MTPAPGRPPRADVRPLAVLAAAAAALVVPLYLIAVRTGWGQRLDERASGELVEENQRVLRAAESFLHVISVGSLAAVGTTLVLVALLRGRHGTFDPWGLPLVNTLILLTSGTTVTWAHHALLQGDRRGLKWGLALTVVLGILFTACQAYEYVHAGFKYAGHIYGATFFMATGFHGAHVIIGTLFLTVCFFRALAGHFTPKQHFGFEAAAWYWHFVDVVWLFLFACIYVIGAGTPLAH